MTAAKQVMLTCYDASFAKLLTESNCVDYLLVGDSLGMVIAGENSTHHVTLEQMKYHAAAVMRGRALAKTEKKPAVIVDLPIGTYDTAAQALKSAESFRDIGLEWIKIEGPMLEQVTALRENKFKVCAHIGLTPQSFDEYKVQGKSTEDQERLLKEAIALEKAGAEMIVLELIPKELAAKISNQLQIPTIGIGAGPETDGQVLVLYDLLGLNPNFQPKFLKTYLKGAEVVQAAVQNYAQEVKEKKYPDDSHSFHLSSFVK